MYDTDSLPPKHENPDDDVITVSDLKIYNAVVGGQMSLEYTMDVTEEIEDGPLAVFEMSSAYVGLPCFEDNFGSCTYRMCEGTSDVEKQIGAPWNNECPIPPGTYHSYLNVTIPSMADLYIEESRLYVEVEYSNSEEYLGCVEFGATVEGA
ncbi:hypothetical protein HPB52_012702 [Rhipicephalus sanguineus]|uniref:MD-2-related lipid-recognition domain-containing protein n=1 Tax=Rhipicephalus sanguineus TaxID=34632 RepID=A0A9D4PFW8_RHISA|nr:hypothetical protein HPB52_012702 [Rhipicephalus sanguineus]